MTLADSRCSSISSARKYCYKLWSAFLSLPAWEAIPPPQILLHVSQPHEAWKHFKAADAELHRQTVGAAAAAQQ